MLVAHVDDSIVKSSIESPLWDSSGWENGLPGLLFAVCKKKKNSFVNSRDNARDNSAFLSHMVLTSSVKTQNFKNPCFSANVFVGALFYR